MAESRLSKSPRKPPAPKVAKARSALATSVQHDHGPERVAAARRDLTAAKIESAIEAAVAAAPPLTPEQRQRLALILSPGLARTAADA